MPVYRVTVGGKEYTVEVPNPRERPVRAIVDGEVLEVQVETATAAPASAPAPRPAAPAIPAPAAPVAAAPAGAGDIKAPLPGTVVSIAVSVGDTVERGQELCIIEAMKMNNPIRATRAGQVSKIHVSVGQQVQHGAALLSIEG